jgi:hypothetical protein
MTTIQTLSTGTRIATALAVVGFVSAAWMAAGHESRHAVESSAVAMSAQPQFVTLPSVEIVGQRELPASATALAAGTRATNEL